MTKIKATLRSCREVADCDRCREDPDNVRLIHSYKNQPSVEEAEKLLYEDIFREEMVLQNEAYRKKGNYGRIWTLDEFRTSVRYRPNGNVLQIGSKKIFLPPHDMWDAYREYHKWRMKNFRDIFALISVVVYMGNVPHIHERYVLCHTDENGVRHTAINDALEQVGVGLPFPEIEKSRNNNRKEMFDQICREAWLDCVEEKLKAFPGLELERPDPDSKSGFHIDREYRLGVGRRRALRNAWERYARRANELQARIFDLREEREEILSEMERGTGTADEMAALRERHLIVKGKLKIYEERLEKLDKKLDTIDDTIVNL